MRRIIAGIGLSFVLVVSTATVTGASNGNATANAYGKRIQECTTHSYGQLKKLVRNNDLAGLSSAIQGIVIEGVRPGWGVKKTWLQIRNFCPATPVGAPLGT